MIVLVSTMATMMIAMAIVFDEESPSGWVTKLAQRVHVHCQFGIRYRKTERPSVLWFWGPNSIMVVYMDPLGSNGKLMLVSTMAIQVEVCACSPRRPLKGSVLFS